MAKKETQTEQAKKAFQEVLHVLQNQSFEAEEGTSTPDVRSITHQIEDQIALLQDQSERLCDSVGMSRDELKTYADNSDNFSPDQWQLLNDLKGEMERYQHEAYKMMHETMGPSQLESRKITKTPEQKEKAAAAKKRRVSKKNWKGV